MLIRKASTVVLNTKDSAEDPATAWPSRGRARIPPNFVDFLYLFVHDRGGLANGRCRHHHQAMRLVW